MTQLISITQREATIIASALYVAADHCHDDELIQLADAIRARQGKAAEASALCAHGIPFGEICPDCDHGEGERVEPHITF